MMEMVQLSQKEIKILLELLESQDLCEVQQNVFDLVVLHEKLTSSQTY
jgi:hypothetical protein